MSNVASKTLIRASWYVCISVGSAAYTWNCGVVGIDRFSFSNYRLGSKAAAPSDAPPSEV